MWLRRQTKHYKNPNPNAVVPVLAKNPTSSACATKNFCCKLQPFPGFGKQRGQNRILHLQSPFPCIGWAPHRRPRAPPPATRSSVFARLSIRFAWGEKRRKKSRSPFSPICSTLFVRRDCTELRRAAPAPVLEEEERLDCVLSPSPPSGSQENFVKISSRGCGTHLMSNIVMVGSEPPSPCDSYLLFHGETLLSNGVRAFIYLAVLAYCFIGLSAVTARFFKSMESIMKHSREVVTIDPHTNEPVVKQEKVWNYTIADIALLAFGTSFPQISLATIDAFRNLGQLTAGGLGPGTLVGSAAFDLFPIHAVCVIMPRAGSKKKISDLGVWLVELCWSFWAYIWLYIILEVWTPKVITLTEALLTVLQYGLLLLHAYAQDKRWPYVSIPFVRGDRPEDWVPEEDALVDYDNCDEISETLPVTAVQNEDTVDLLSMHSYHNAEYLKVPEKDVEGSSTLDHVVKSTREDTSWLRVWLQQFIDAVTLESPESRKMDSTCLRFIRIFWNLILAPWKLLFAFVPPYHIAHGWIAFICTLTFISGIAYGVTKLTDQISCVTGVSPYVIAFTALAAGTSWPDLVASKIAAERQITADSAIANITCSNSVNIYVGIGVPWLVNTAYNFFVYKEPLYIDNAAGLSFSLLIFFATSFGCITILVLRRIIIGAELGGPRLWAWVTSVYFMILWVIFVVLSSLRFSGVI
ncbi:hypothetical protein EJB05_26080 [Eragrostis curvula]|uniref:Sodium/calcium exchanger membrane region domain-containing protein n=1 Tax=Eragrostis curvula TaxID=38414 RepID=A0A5J9UK66_9POAL|nr:hypothetical protein EJB05_26080 [Eragrostis curvula]